MTLRGTIAPLSAIAAGAAYGLLARLVFDAPAGAGHAGLFAGVSLAFLFLVPFGLGALTAALAPPNLTRPLLYRTLMPWASTLLLIGATLALAWEGFICIIMAAPILFTMAMMGGLIMGVRIDRRRETRPTTIVASCLVLPFLFAPVEAQLPEPDDVRTVTTVVDVDAPPGVVWSQVIRVPPLQPGERADGFFQQIGIPRPLEATLSHDGVGGLREASFEGGIRFLERVTEWEPDRRLGFTIAVDPATVSAANTSTSCTARSSWSHAARGRACAWSAGITFVPDSISMRPCGLMQSCATYRTIFAT